MTTLSELKGMVGRTYADSHGITVTVTQVARSSGGSSVGGMKRKGKISGFTLTLNNGKFEVTMGYQMFTQRGFKDVTPQS